MINYSLFECWLFNFLFDFDWCIPSQKMKSSGTGPNDSAKRTTSCARKTKIGCESSARQRLAPLAFKVAKKPFRNWCLHRSNDDRGKSANHRWVAAEEHPKMWKYRYVTARYERRKLQAWSEDIETIDDCHQFSINVIDCCLSCAFSLSFFSVSSSHLEEAIPTLDNDANT